MTSDMNDTEQAPDGGTGETCLAPSDGTDQQTFLQTDANETPRPSPTFKTGESGADTTGKSSLDFGEERTEFAYRLGEAPRASALALLEFALSRRVDRSCFADRLLAIAAYGSGTGLYPAPRPVVALTTRTSDLASLTALAELLAEDRSVRAGGETDTPPVQLCRFHGDIAASNTPALLAEFLSSEISAGRLVADKLVVLLSEDLRSPAWEAVSLCRADPLSNVLRAHGKQLVIGFQLDRTRAVSSLVHPDNRIVPLPWVLPFAVSWAERRNLNPDRIDLKALLDFEAATTWQERQNDRAEQNAFSQKADDLAKARTPEDFSALLAIDWTRGNPFDVAIKSDERRTRVNIAFGLEDPASDDPGADKRPPGPAVLRSALLFTVAFCQRLPGPAFRRFARSCLNGETRVRFADLDDMDRRHFEELKTVVPDGTNIADELPLLTAYFDKWADRLLQYDDIRPRPDGRYELGKEWGSFDLAGHIGSAAPMTAEGLVYRVLINIQTFGAAERLDDRVVLETLAAIRCYLPTSLAASDLVAWLKDYALKPFLIAQLTEAGKAKLTFQQMRERISHAAFLAQEMNDGLRADGDPTLARMASRQLARTVTMFLTAHALIAVQRDPHQTPDFAALAESLTEEALWSEDWPDPFTVSFALWMMLFGPPGRPAAGSRDLRNRIAVFSRDRRSLTLIRTVVHEFLHARFDDWLVPSAPMERLARIVRLLESGRGEAPGAWQVIGDVLTEHIVNLEIRWPTPQSGLISYQNARLHRFAGLVVQKTFQEDQPEIRLVRDHLIERFFAVAPGDWLARSGGNAALSSAHDRLKDVLYVLLDGVPEKAETWRAMDTQNQAATLLRALCAHCDAPTDLTLSAFVPALSASRADAASPDAAGLLDLYGLFWPALLLHWRCQAFGVEPIGRDRADAKAFRAFIDELRKRVSAERIAELRQGLSRLARATDEALAHEADAHGDRVARKYYAAKAEAARKLAMGLGARSPDPLKVSQGNLR